MNNKESFSRQTQRSRRCLSQDGIVMITSFIGVVIGVAVGLALHFAKATKIQLLWIGIPGELYLRMLNAAAIPLAVCSVISTAAKLKSQLCLGRVWGVALGYIVITNLIGATIGAVLAVIIKPGSGVQIVEESNDYVRSDDLFADLIRNFVPDNIVTAFFQNTETKYSTVTVTKPPTDSGNISTNSSTVVQEIKSSLGTANYTNLLGLVIACSALGAAAAHSGDVVQPFVTFCTGLTSVIMRLVKFMFVLTPIGAASIIAVAIGGASDLETTFDDMKLYLLAFLVGCLLLFIGTLPLTYFIFLRRNPLYFLAGAVRPALLALVTRSSARCLPDVMRSAEQQFGVDEMVSRSVSPFAVNINRDGCIMYIALTAVYMTQCSGDDTAGNVILIILLSTLGPLMGSGTGGTLLLISATLGFPRTNWATFVILEWFCDRIRTTANVYSHVMCCVVTWRLCKEKLTKSSYDIKSLNEDDEFSMTEKGLDGTQT